MEQLGSYSIEKQIGEGSFATVVIAKNAKTGKEVAIKVVKPTSTQREDVQLEVNLMRLLHHPNIIQLYEVIERPETGSQCLVMEYAPRGELFDYIIKKGQLAESEAKKLFAQLVSAVEHMHSKNVVHRDIKPENLLLDSDNNLKLSDFGLSSFCAPNCLLKDACGSPLYSAPEIFRQSPYDGRAADVWAMGVVLFAMVTGEIPWNGRSLKEQVVNIVKGEFQLPPFLSTECKNLIKSMLVVSPTKRATISQIKTHPWLSKSRSMVDLMTMMKISERTNRPADKLTFAPIVIKAATPSKSKRRSSPDLNTVKLPILVK